ncbi:MAG: hypothetical protein ACJ8FY_14315 [Gemmataceae bacterium]
MLKRLLLAAFAVMILPLASAQAGGGVRIGIGVPFYRGYYHPHYYGPRFGVFLGVPPVYVGPPPVYVAPAPVYVQPAPAPVYVQPAPAPAYAPPPPVPVR